MNRIQVLISVLVAVLLVVLFYFLLYAPRQEELVAIEDLIAEEEVQHTELRSELSQLREVRSRAPELEAHLAAARSVLPEETQVPALYRQLQTAADDAGVELLSINTGRAQEVVTDGVEGADGAAALSLTLQIDGNYLQLVDLLRRIEDPELTPRGVRWTSATLTRGDEWPVLSLSLTGAAYAVLPAPPPEPVDEPAPVDDDGTDNDTDDDADDEPDNGQPDVEEDE